MESKTKTKLIIKIILATIFISVLTYISIRFTSQITHAVKNPEDFRRNLLSYGNLSYIVFIGFQILHILIPAIPGELVQIAGGYIFGTFWGTIFMLIGTTVGSAIVFYSTRLIGYSLVKMLVPADKMDKFTKLMSGKKAEISMFILFLIPGTPKDTLIYIASLTPVKPLRFIIISLVARFPGLLGSAYIGTNILQKNYVTVTIFVAICTLLFIIGLIFRDRIVQWSHNVFHKKSS